MSTSSIKSVLLASIVPASGDAAIRKLNLDHDLDALAASIGSLGVLFPVIVREGAEGWEVIDGNRRVAALRLLAERGAIDAETYEVPITVKALEAVAETEVAIHANTMRLDMHPLDEAEAFERLNRQGMDFEAIAKRSGVTVQRVKQRMALTALAPVVRDSYKAGLITLDIARVYTGASVEQQAKVFAAAQRDRWIASSPDALRRSLRADAVGADDRRFLFVGSEAYEAAGGTYVEDLFQDYRQIKDVALLDDLLAKAVRRQLKKETKAGWAAVDYVAVKDSHTHPWVVAGGQHYQTVGEADADFRARSRALFSISMNGDWTLRQAFPVSQDAEPEAPEVEAPETGAAASGAGVDPADTFKANPSVGEAIRAALEGAIGAKVAADPLLAKRLLVAHLAMLLTGTHFAGAFDLNAGEAVMQPALAAWVDTIHGDDFAACFEATAGQDVDALLAAALGSLVMVSPRCIQNATPEAVTLVSATGVDLAAVYTPDADYFERFGKSALVELLASFAPQAAGRVRSKDKAAVVAACVREAGKRGWQVPELTPPKAAAEPMPEASAEAATAEEPEAEGDEPSDGVEAAPDANAADEDGVPGFVRAGMAGAGLDHSLAA